MGQAAAASSWDTGPVYRPPDARPEWEESAPRPVPPAARTRSVAVRVDAERAESALADLALERARRALAVQRRLDRATARATRAIEQRRRRAAAAQARRDVAREQETARRVEHHRRLALATKLERMAAELRDYEEWARSRGLRVAAGAGLSIEADRLAGRVDELRYR